jgi:lipopolysaccharide transport system ATP-binding protein
MSTVISIDQVSKSYRLGAIGGAMLSEDLSRWWAKIRRKSDPLSKVGRDHARIVGDQFWALQDVSFDVKQGEALGIIGRNGAGKSTLLKILSQVTAPTTGRIKLRGRSASLLEVGTGFHQELTGRENIYLNGAILGMTKSEVRNKFDEIVAFSECEEFIGTPVKRYSSGMYVRLAFAVAAHLEPEILIIDEVLAVGDASFQRKCIRKIGEVGQEGRTVLVVSHNMAVMTSLCSRAVLLEDGRVVKEGAPETVASAYLKPVAGSKSEVSWNPADPVANNGRIRLVGARVLPSDPADSHIELDKPFALELDFEALLGGLNICSSIHVYDKHAVCAFVSGTSSKVLDRGMYRHTYRFPANLMNDGQYSITIIMLTDTDRWEVHVNNAIYFTVHEMKGREDYLGTVTGCVRPVLEINEKALPRPA